MTKAIAFSQYRAISILVIYGRKKASMSFEKFLEIIKGLTGTFTDFVQWVAGLFRDRKWVEILMLVVAIAVPVVGSRAAIANYFKDAEPYVYLFWGAVGIIFAVAIAIELRKPPSITPFTRDSGKRTAIKFLSSFEQEDAEIFSRLQGYRDLRPLSENIIRPEFCFGILKGKSGSGKTSFVQAGLLAQLAQTDSYRGVYLKFSNLEPLETVRDAFVKEFKLAKEEVNQLDFLTLLARGVEVAAQDCEDFQALVLIFDQFEQFFLYIDRAKREAFIQALAAWYGSDDLAEKVKILVSVREDWFARLDEVQEVLGYSLTTGSRVGGNSFYLRNFSPEEATMILQVMAAEDLGIESDSDKFDSNYLQEVLERELSSQEEVDRLISPVNLQIIAETIKQQNRTELRAFNQRTFEKLGGIEGILQSFLDRILEELGEERKKTAVQVLMALTNLEQQTRAEVQPLEKLQEKVGAAVHSGEVRRIADYLKDAGLVAIVEREGTTGYELAHEQMIPAIIRMGWQVKNEAYRANQLLERRVNQWLGDNRNPRFLLDLWELLLIRRQKPYLIWGTKRQQKKELIAASWRIYRVVTSVIATVVVVVTVFCGWLWYTPQGQIQQVRWKINNPLGSSLERVSDRRAAEAAIAIAKDQRWQLAFNLVDKYIKRSEDRASFIVQFAKIVPQQEDSNQAQASLKKALTATEQINNPYSQYLALRAIAEVYGQLKDEAAAQEGLKLALQVTEQIKNSYSQYRALRAIAEVYGQLKDEAAAQEVLKLALQVTEQIKDPDSQSDALSAIAEASVQTTNIEVTQAILHDTLLIAQAANASSTLEKISVQYAQQYAWGKALRALRNCPESLKVNALTQILTLWAEKTNPKLIDGAVVLELKVKDTPEAYTFDVSILSPDRDCNQYADWWEVLSEDGDLLYRQVFQENHIDEQPFKSTGEPIKIEADRVVIVRAHMHTNYSDDTGYEAMQAWKGSVDNGFEFIRLSKNFAKNVAKEDPQPPKCQKT